MLGSHFIFRTRHFSTILLDTTGGDQLEDSGQDQQQADALQEHLILSIKDMNASLNMYRVPLILLPIKQESNPPSNFFKKLLECVLDQKYWDEGTIN